MALIFGLTTTVQGRGYEARAFKRCLGPSSPGTLQKDFIRKFPKPISGRVHKLYTLLPFQVLLLFEGKGKLYRTVVFSPVTFNNPPTPSRECLPAPSFLIAAEREKFLFLFARTNISTTAVGKIKSRRALLTYYLPKENQGGRLPRCTRFCLSVLVQLLFIRT